MPGVAVTDAFAPWNRTVTVLPTGQSVPSTVLRTQFNTKKDGGIGPRYMIGLITLKTDEVNSVPAGLYK